MQVNNVNNVTGILMITQLQLHAFDIGHKVVPGH
ncbi:MAG: hypothetical protein JWP81_3407 [Ferruginibacter sp.]|nr:hypothetical protein [Ferruginibacter sp.]